ncbi:MAG: aspartate carbamoyltransferase [Anaerolineae bacterium]|jgi:aspartate carbamoyltransferase catalytic subunit|nr:aspartate carbamoyltransferase [Chloroflexota bacterium]
MVGNSSPKKVGLAADRLASFYGRDIVSVDQFSRQDLGYIYGVADEMRSLVKRVGATDLLKGHVLANLFYEPSTRTSSSFIAAMVRLGGSVIPIHGVQYSSVSKGESLPDTIRTLQCYSDVIVLRHPEIGASAVAARYANIPVISAGDGTGEHPTQGLLDIYTIYSELGTVDGLHVAMVGDLKNGRTVHSLARLLKLYDTEMSFVAPDNLRLPQDIRDEMVAAGRTVHETDRLQDVIDRADVVYVTRVQRERFQDLSEYEAVKDYYVITPALMQEAKPRMALMHPLPRVGEIQYDVDDDPRAAYFRQMENGMYVRMALLAAVLGKV